MKALKCLHKDIHPLVTNREELRLRLIAVKQEIILFSTEPIIRKLADIGDINFTNNGQTEVQAKEKFDKYLSLLNLMR